MRNSIRKIITLLIGCIDTLLRKKPSVTVLSYHSIGADEWEFSISEKTFRRQIEALEKSHSFITVSDLESYLRETSTFNKPAILITFDDGYQNILSIQKFLSQKNIKPVLFWESDPKHIQRNEIDNSLPLLTDEQIHSLLADGWSLGCHSATHANLLHEDDNGLVKEIVESKKIIENVYNKTITTFAYPRGYYNDAIVKLVSTAKYRLAFTMNDAFISTKTNPLLIPRIGIMKKHSLKEFMAMQRSSVIRAKRLFRTLTH